MIYAVINSLRSALPKKLWQCPKLFSKFSFSYFKILSLVLIFSQIIISCNKPNNRISVKERNYIDSLVKSAGSNVTNLNNLYNSFEAKNNQLGCIVTLKEIGRIQRNESNFEEALKMHNKELHLAEDLNDTIEIIQALNNIGTDFRRLGILESATPYHYRAWKLSEAYSDTSYSAKKNYVVSLNGLGNIYMSTSNYDKAEEVLRKALKGEQYLKSSLGQAINYANLGSIFSHRQQLDSAWAYYRNSMKYNTEAKSTLGIALCHNYFGSLYEKQGEYSNAIEEYNKSRAIMEKSKDEWHTLNATLSLINVYIKTGKYDLALNNLSLADGIATKIKSLGHRADILHYYYLLNKGKGEWRKALEYNEQANILKDSVVDINKLNKIQNLSIAIEREQQERIAKDALTQYTAERRYRISIFLILGSIVLFLAGLAIILFNATRIRQRNIKFLQQLSNMRENFFVNITHELRTPLTIIMGLSNDIGKSEDIPEKTRDMGRVIERHGKNLLTLINQLLDISKIKSAQGNSDWRHGSITTYTSMIIDGYRDYAHRKNIDLQYIADNNIDMDFVPDYVNKIINNLLSNALKFTPEGGKIIIRAEPENNMAVFYVSDTGCGISKESIDTIFEPFVQADNNSKNIGTGVGLALVKQIVKSIEGSISVTSNLNEGSTFTIKVPMRHGNEKFRELDEVVNNDSIMIPEDDDNIPEDIELENGILDDGNRVHILIIEDNNDVARYIGNQLSDKYDIHYAQNGKQGLEKARDMMPDLIITDLMMPEMNGLEVCKEVRKDEFISHIPIIIITARTSEKDRIKGLEAGADAYLGKPFNSEELKVRVEKLLEQRQYLRDKFTQAIVDGKEAELQRTDTDRNFLCKIVDNAYILMEKKELDINTLAEKLFMSPRQFHRKVMGVTGETPASYLLQIKMRKAKQLLDTKPNLSIEEISDSCGFDHYSGFYHAFKKTYGVTPSQYKRGAK